MALAFNGLTKCPLCERVINSDDQIVAFPAFLSPDDPFWPYSDAAFHSSCFSRDPNAKAVQGAYLDWQIIWDSRPKNLATEEERIEWAKQAFAKSREEYR